MLRNRNAPAMWVFVLFWLSHQPIKHIDLSENDLQIATIMASLTVAIIAYVALDKLSCFFVTSAAIVYTLNIHSLIGANLSNITAELIIGVGYIATGNYGPPERILALVRRLSGHGGTVANATNNNKLPKVADEK